jgi:DNA replication protein DnaC
LFAAGCPPELSETSLVGETVAWYEDAEERLRLCAVCPTGGGACHGSLTLFKQGQLPVWQGEAVKAAPCKRYREWRLRERLAISNVPERYRGCTLKDFKVTTPQQHAAHDAVVQFMEELLAGGEPWLVLSGPHLERDKHDYPGCGKTHLGCAVLRSVPLTMPRKHFWYADMNELRIEMKGFNFDSGETDPLDRLRTTELLVLDNMEAQRLKKETWLKERVEDVLYQRWNRRRATLITTHETFDDLARSLPGITTINEATSCSLV